MDTKANMEENKGRALFDALTALVNGEELKMMIGTSPEAGAVHLVLPRSLVIQTQTVNVAHLSEIT